MSKIRVLSVDDSALMRQIMTEIINSHSDMEMVATAPDPLPFSTRYYNPALHKSCFVLPGIVQELTK